MTDTERRLLAEHEAGHTSAAICVGMDPQSVTVEGQARASHVGSDRVSPIDLAAVIYAPHLLARCVPSEDSTDAQQIYAIFKHQRWTLDDVDRLALRTAEIVASPKFRALHKPIAKALERRGALDAYDLHRITAVADPTPRDPKIERQVKAQVDKIERRMLDEAAWSAVFMVKSLVGSDEDE